MTKQQEQIDLYLEDALDALCGVEQWLENARYWDTGIGDHAPQDKSIDVDLPRVRRIKREVHLFIQDRTARRSDK